MIVNMKKVAFFLTATCLTLAFNFAQGAAMIDELEPLSINGTDQWLLYRGEEQTKPVVLFVHGGPGSPLMYFSRGFDDAFTKDFVVVHWDQRGSGKSYDPKVPTNSYHFQQFVDDGLAVVTHIKNKFQKKKIILVGHSWGTMLAFNMAAQYPKSFESLVSIGTVSNMGKMEEFRFMKVKSAIQTSGNADALERLKDLGTPPYLTFDELTEFGNLLSEFVGFEGTFRLLPMEKINEAVQKNKEYTEQEMTASMEGMAVVFNSLSDFLYKYNASKFVPEVEMPVYFVQGRHDLNTPTELARNYFDDLKADAGKTWIEFDESAHFPMYEEPNRFLQVLKSASGSKNDLSCGHPAGTHRKCR